MNAMWTPPAPGLVETVDQSPAWIDAERAASLVRVLAAIYAGLVVALLGLQASTVSSLALIAAAAAMVPLAGLLATLPLAQARARFGHPRIRPASSGRLARVGRRLHLGRAAVDQELRLGQLARRPQGVIVPVTGACIVTLLLILRSSVTVGPHAVTAGIAALVLGFPLLVAERIMGAVRPASLPEADALRALLFVPVIVVPAAGLLTIGAAVGLPNVPLGGVALEIAVGLTAVELAMRALANWFLPPPAAIKARAAVESVAARLLQPRRLAPDGVAAPLRQHFGIDFSRSWALGFARSASVPVVLALGVIAWGLTGVTLIEQDRRGIYERFGEPAAVWAPGAHVGLPWPLGRVRRVDLGVVHAIALGGDPGPGQLSPAEAAAPASADRLWDQVHPSEVSYLLASRESDGRQGFQTVNVDMTILYRIGPDDRSALRAAYAVATPDALVRSEAGRLMARELAGAVTEDLLGAGRETMAETLRAKLQTALDTFDGGIELVAVALEAVHPPPAAAEAYHNVQAAEIIANTAISTERGRALAASARDRQRSTELVLQSVGAAAETTGRAEVAGRVFAADRVAAAVGERSFLLERYLATVSAALATSPLVIVDRDLAGADAPSIDLRSFGAPPARAAGDD